MRSLRPPFDLLGALALAGLPALVSAQHVGSEFQVNTYTPKDQQTQRDHVAVADANGNFVVVWSSDLQDGSGEGVFGQRYDSAGETLGSEFRVNSHTTGRQWSPSAAAAADGRFVVVWSGDDEDGSGTGVFGQRYDAEGGALGSEFRVNSYTTGTQGGPSVASDTGGNFVVVWNGQGQGDGSGVFGQRFDSGGLARGAEFRVNSYTTGGQVGFSAASDATGHFVVVWSGSGQGDSNGVFGRRFDGEGVPQSDQFRVNSYTFAQQERPSVASDLTGNFVIVWQGIGPASEDGFGIFGQRFDSVGLPQGQEFKVNSYTTDNQKYPSVSSDAQGNFVVAWSSWDQEDHGLFPVEWGVFGQRYESSGAPSGVEFQINSFSTHSQRTPSVVATGDESFAVFWQSADQDGDGSGVYGQRIHLAGDTVPPVVRVDAPDGNEILYTASSYWIRWTASDDVALSSIDVLASADDGETYTPIAECQDLPAAARSCLWLAPGPPAAEAFVRVTAEDTSGNRDADDSNRSFEILPGTASVTVQRPNTEVLWRVGSVETIEWAHNLGFNATFRIELDRDDDGHPDDVIAAAAPPDGATTGRFSWVVIGPSSPTCRVYVSWTGSPSVSDSSDATFQIRPALWTEFQINTYTTSQQRTGSDHLIAADADGNFVVVWESYTQDGSSGGIFAQRYDSAGDPVGGEFRVNSYTTGAQSQPSVASAASGNFVIVWDSDGQDGDRRGIFGQRFDATGGPLGAEFQVNAAGGGDQQQPSVASDPSGNFVVAWSGVSARRFNSDGTPLGAEFSVGSGSFPSVATDASGNFVVVWFTVANSTDVFGRRYDSEGQPLGGEFLVNTYTTGGQSRPSVASDPGGNFVVVWRGVGQGIEGILGQRFDPQGERLGGEFQVNTGSPYFLDSPAVAVSAAGEFVVAWANGLQDGDANGIFGRRFDGAGLPVGDEFQVNSFTPGDQEEPSVVAAGAGKFVVAWTSDPAQDGSQDGVFGQRFDFGGAGTITLVSPNTNVRWRVGSSQRIQWTHNLGPNASFRIELDRDDDGDYEELIAAAATAEPTRGSFTWSVTAPPSATARVRVAWTDDAGVADTSDVTFQIRPAP
jgi:hypothetical protein